MEKGKGPRKTVPQVKSSFGLSHMGCALDHQFHDRQGDQLFIFPISHWLVFGL